LIHPWKQQLLLVQNQWWTLFSTIVSRASTLEVFSTGVAGNYNGALQLVCTENVKTRICCFYLAFVIR
jgi:homeobox-leucine zipper protein